MSNPKLKLRAGSPAWRKAQERRQRKGPTPSQVQRCRNRIARCGVQP
jgi:hypothetical protein